MGLELRIPRFVKGLACVQPRRSGRRVCREVMFGVTAEKKDGYTELYFDVHDAVRELENLEAEYHGVGFYKCPYCGAEFQTPDALASHVLQHELNKTGIRVTLKEGRVKCADMGWGFLCLHRKKYPMVFGWYGDEDTVIIVEDEKGLERFIDDFATDIVSADALMALAGGLKIITESGQELEGEEAARYIASREREVRERIKRMIKRMFRL